MGGFLLTHARRVFLTIKITGAISPRPLDTIVSRAGATSSLILT
jgi:hypothetical protein